MKDLWMEGMAIISCWRCLSDLVCCQPKNVEMHMNCGFGMARYYDNLEVHEADGERIVACVVCGHCVGTEKEDDRQGVRLHPRSVVEKRYVQCLPGPTLRWCCITCGVDICPRNCWVRRDTASWVKYETLLNCVVRDSHVTCRICGSGVGAVASEDVEWVIIDVSRVMPGRGSLCSERILRLDH